ncbi:MAG TPA: hydantoinase/oxoprolinase family protein [Chloroflexota bacterium]|nr:hydantoinase/oxoprolinase family protein [Chloroflexota bacterium]
MRIAVDIGGTFTDLVANGDEGQTRTTKALTTPDNHVEGIRDCLAKLAVDLSAVDLFVHGSTIAINTVVERKGARTGLITTEGFRDVYEIARGNRPDAYNVHFHKPEPLVPRDLRLEVRERVNARGEVLTPLDEASLARAVAALEAADVQSVAVCLLHAYANPAHEQAVGRYLAARHPEWAVSLSHQIVREIREYERTSTTVLNAYIAPVVGRYLASLEDLLAASGFRGLPLIMQSNGGVMSVATARAVPVAMMESGPVAGVMGAAAVGQALGFANVISFDMGGTTAKTSLVRDGELEVTTTYYIGGYATGHPMMLPVVDIVEVGAGGGSIAWLDPVGALKVGPRSAGAQPGPACFGRGGTEPTVTDANVVLGRIDPGDFLGGELRIDRVRAEAALATIAGPLGMTTTEAALGIVTIADASMSLAVRAVSVERGRDPRDFALVVSGGGGPLHGVGIARDLGIPVVIVPQRSSVFSAVGLLSAPLRHDYVQTALGDMARLDLAALDTSLDALEAEAARTLASEGARPDAMIFTRLVDLRYVGQEHTLSVPVAGRLAAGAAQALRERFDALHAERYGHNAPAEPVQVVNLRLRAQASSADREWGARDGERLASPNPYPQPSSPQLGTRPIVFDQQAGAVDCPVYARERLAVGARVEGPAVIQEYGSATLLHAGDVAEVSPQGHLVVTVAVP